MTRSREFAALLMLMPSIAMAHDGHGADALHGLLHPLTGIDHLIAMLAVGWWSAASARSWWRLPALFAGSLLAGALIGRGLGNASPLIEWGIVASLLAIGVAMALRVHATHRVAAAIVCVAGALHGHAHGVEMPGDATAFAWLAGMAIGTLLLHLAGAAFGTALRRAAWSTRAAGIAVASAALLLASG